MSSPRTRPYALPAALWFIAIVLSVVQAVLVVTADFSYPLALVIGALFLAAALLTLLRRR